jgi:long-subunit fatty acid transport protein
MTRLKCVLFMGVILALGGATQSFAQVTFSSMRISSTFNPVGSGARAMGMGGAFIAVADDATAASWNPGGLIQLETPEISMVYSTFQWRENYSSDLHPEAAGMNETSIDDLNYLSVALPFQLLGHNFVGSLNYQRLYDMYKNLDFGYNYAGQFSTGNTWSLDMVQSFKQKGGIRAFAPALAYQVTSRFSVGATFNIWTDKLFWSNGWSEVTHARGQGMIGNQPFETTSLTYDKFSGFEGFNCNLGFLWDLSRIISIGGVFKTPFTADLKHRHYFQSTQTFPTLGRTVTNEDSPPPDNMHVKMPASYGLGIALRFSDAFTYSLDASRTEWSEFFRVIPAYQQVFGDTNYSDIDNLPRYRSIVHDTTQVRTGMEYLFILDRTIIPLRCGLFYDPRPSHKHPHTMWGYTLGSGFMVGKLVIDYAYQFRTGNNIEGGVLGIPTAKADVDQHTFYLSMIYHFE